MTDSRGTGVPTRRAAPARCWLTLSLACLAWGLTPHPIRSDGAAPLPLPSTQGCYGLASYGIAMFGDGQGSVTVTPPGPILGVYLHWVGVEDATPGGASTSDLIVNGVSVTGTLSAGSAGFAPRPSWYSWWANIGPAGGPFPGLGLVDDLNRQVDVSAWDGSGNATNGATVTVIYDTGACPIPNTIAIETGVDWYFRGDSGQESSELLVFAFPPAAVDRLVSFHVGHAGTDASQSSCRGGAVWMLAGSGAAPAPGAFDLNEIGGGGRAYGINGGVEILNDPFTNASLPCVAAVNPPPDEPYAPGHPCPGGGSTCPYRALALRPVDGGDVGAEWAVVEVDVLVPAGSEWVAFQLESEADQNGESGSWAGSSYVLTSLPECGNGVLEPGEGCDDGNRQGGDGCSADCQPDVVANRPPEITCAPCVVCNDPGICAADLACGSIATACDPDDDPVQIDCSPTGPYPVGTTGVMVTASDGTDVTSVVCQLTVRDCEPPVCAVPPVLTVECRGPCGLAGDDPVLDPWLGGVTASDNCAVAGIDRAVPPLLGATCAGGATTPIVVVVTDTAGYERSCVGQVRVEDRTPPTLAGCELAAVPVLVPLPPLPPLPPMSPMSPQSPASACSGPSSALARIVCGLAADDCSGRPDVEAVLVLEGHDTSGGACVPVELVVPAECGEIVELQLTPPPCPVEPAAPRPASGRRPDGVLVLAAERIRLELTARDRCGNASATCVAEVPGPGTVLPCAPSPGACPVPPCELPAVR